MKEPLVRVIILTYNRAEYIVKSWVALSKPVR